MLCVWCVVCVNQAATLLAEEYVAMRRLGRGHGKTITATTRQLESLIRLSEAHARMRLSQVVDLDAVKEAARLVRVALHQVRPFISSFSRRHRRLCGFNALISSSFFVLRSFFFQAATDPRTGTIDMDLLTTGRSATARERTSDLANAIQQLLLSHTGTLDSMSPLDPAVFQSLRTHNTQHTQHTRHTTHTTHDTTRHDTHVHLGWRVLSLACQAV